MKKFYKNQEEIVVELQKLKLKRDISIEELKIVKQQFKEDISISSWLQTAFRTLGRFGAYNLAKKIIK